jgi:hypothetical protein
MPSITLTRLPVLRASTWRHWLSAAERRKAWGDRVPGGVSWHGRLRGIDFGATLHGVSVDVSCARHAGASGLRRPGENPRTSAGMLWRICGVRQVTIRKAGLAERPDWLLPLDVGEFLHRAFAGGAPLNLTHVCGGIPEAHAVGERFATTTRFARRRRGTR